MNSMYISQTHTTEIATDGQPLSAAVSVQESSLAKYMDDGLDAIRDLFAASFRDAQGDIEHTINAHPFYVLYEPRLGAGAGGDAATARSVYPVFKADLLDIMQSLEARVAKQVAPILRGVVQKREEVLGKTMQQNQQLTANASEEAAALRRQC